MKFVMFYPGKDGIWKKQFTDAVSLADASVTFQNKFKMKLIWALLHLLVSGFPIIQDGKLVRAITHVLVNDPTRGYGIFIENMLDASE